MTTRMEMMGRLNDWAKEQGFENSASGSFDDDTEIAIVMPTDGVDELCKFLDSQDWYLGILEFNPYVGRCVARIHPRSELDDDEEEEELIEDYWGGARCTFASTLKQASPGRHHRLRR